VYLHAAVFSKNARKSVFKGKTFYKNFYKKLSKL